ncbi:MAG: bifunctional diaminohydroxyphosphoribosylaminopyrimidine deaminase/5-amino-6-(5-phosphoribosylamino)uracil reductase RibD [Candidatus Latescibacterota bacterium]|nr:bifunctional diaminohydroxyphosphoribosylaminopyrimidine deaminase/5-amino-6-(5-phosphoribosylamino)uracil reductase RibD [Candidatus Latescibacterota bacterium]
MTDGRRHMYRALRLARRGRGRVSPNPEVGAVIVGRSGRVLAEGYHRAVGDPHAEVEALRAAGDSVRNAEMYVTLEPCSFGGRTPPCSESVARAGIRKLHCAMEDPDSRVRGRGIAYLRGAGVEVEVGLCQQEAEELNAAYIHHRRTGRPYVRLKLAQSLDARIATHTGASRWITGLEARRHVHRWRSWVDVVAVGAGTVSADDPRLSVRDVRGRDPRPLVVDGRLRCSPTARVFAGQRPILVTTESSARQRGTSFRDRGVEIWELPEVDKGQIDLGALLDHAGSRGITSLIVEGGPTLATTLLTQGLVQEVMIYIAPKLIGEGVNAVANLGVDSPGDSVQLIDVRTRRLGDDVLYTARVATGPGRG